MADTLTELYVISGEYGMFIWKETPRDVFVGCCQLRSGPSFAKVRVWSFTSGWFV